MARNVTPKGCSVTGVDLDGEGKAELRLSCAAGPYRSKHLRGVRSVHVTEGAIFGAAKIGFVVSPDTVTCTREGSQLRCKRRK